MSSQDTTAQHGTTARAAVPPHGRAAAHHGTAVPPGTNERAAERAAKPLGFFASRAAARTVRQEKEEAERAALARAATKSAARRTAAAQEEDSTARTAEEIAPVPEWMLQAGVWVDRTLGAIPLVAPLGLSAWFTAHVFMDDPMNLPWAVAVLATGALEGGAWKLSRIYERTLLEGDSTISLRLGLGGYLTLISGLIYWHAWYQAGQTFQMGWNWIPAAACALLSWLGIYIWGRAARFQHRVKLRRSGKIDKQAPKFSILSWILTPVQTWAALRHAIVFRIDKPTDAIASLREYRAAGKPAIWPPVVDEDDGTDGTPETARPAIRATAQVGPRPPKRAALPTAHPAGGGTVNGTPEGTLGGTVPSPPTAHGTPGGTVNGTPVTAQRAPAGGTTLAIAAQAAVPPGVPQPSGTADVDATMLRLATHICAVTDAFPGWMDSPPSARKAQPVIAAATGTRGSSSTTQKVLACLDRIAQTADPLETLNRLQPLRENSNSE